MSIKSINLGFILVVLGWFAAGASYSAEISLADAKHQGLVGEQYDGYLGVVASSASSAVSRLVAGVNAKRRAEYERIAQSNQISRADVEALAGQKALQKTAPGHYIKLQGGSWQKK